MFKKLAGIAALILCLALLVFLYTLRLNAAPALPARYFDS